MKRIYLDFEKTSLDQEEQEFLSAFIRDMQSEGFEMQHTGAVPMPEIQAMGTVSLHGTEDVTVAICDDPKRLQAFKERGIPVIGYEAGTGKHLDAKWILLSLEGADADYVKKVYCRTKGLPLTILETERTLIREICMEDMDALFRVYEGEHITDYLEPLYDRPVEEAYERNYIEKIYGFYDYGMWVVFDKATGELIGRAGVESRGAYESASCAEKDRWMYAPDTVEFGFVIREDHQHLGYGTEVGRAILSYTKNVLHKRVVFAKSHPANTAAHKALRSIGFREHGSIGDDRIFIIYI
ncbi:MAG: GNAT family N-acetyltransferase [Lachnospiraceae bacterium]|nr:GNAT family N-acetyltransferase [Lachnospiraceae bacterium]